MDNTEKAIIDQALDIIQLITSNTTEGSDPPMHWIIVNDDNGTSKMDRLRVLSMKLKKAINRLDAVAKSDYNQWANQDI